MNETEMAELQQKLRNEDDRTRNGMNRGGDERYGQKDIFNMIIKKKMKITKLQTKRTKRAKLQIFH
jgi:hypothetical protein